MNFIVNPQTNITPYACSCKGINFGGSNSCNCDANKSCSCNTNRTSSCSTKRTVIACNTAFGCSGLA